MDEDVNTALKALADPTRLRILGRLAAAPAGVAELVADTGLELRVVVRQLALLRRAGLVGPPGRDEAVRYELRLETLQTVGRQLDDRDRGGEDPTLATDDARVLRGYLEEGRLTAIPAATAKRLVVLRWLRDRVFTEDRDYPEREVNQRLALFHPDVAALRRYMVDARLVSRDHGQYRRAVEAEPATGAPARG